MAKKSAIEVFPALYEDGVGLTDIFMTSATKSKVTCIDTTTFGTLTFTGSNFKVNDGIITGGTIKSMLVATDDGDKALTISGLSINVGVLPGETMVELSTAALQIAILGDNKILGTNLADSLNSIALAGNDIVFGKGGDDTLAGGTGKDVLIGGAGEDQFEFTASMGADKIRDFDADNGDGAQDLIDAAFADAAISASANGKDTIVDFGDGDRFILLGVTSTEINASDFTA